MTPLTRDQIEAQRLGACRPGDNCCYHNNLIDTALLAWTEDGKRLCRDVITELAEHIDGTVRVAADALARAEAAELGLATERARREACEAALRPFAAAADFYPASTRDDDQVYIRAGLIRAARAALNPAKENAGE